MLPVLITIFGIPISSFGVFLLLSIMAATYLIWKQARLYEIDLEKILDLILLSLVGALIGARIYYIIFHLSLFNSLPKLLLINRYPGLSFWGGLIGGFLALKVFSKRLKMDFWQIMDFALVGLFVGISISSIGCLLGGCQIGQASNNFMAVNQVGLIGKRFPIQIVEGLLFLIFFFTLWKASLRFHPMGRIAYRGLIILGLLKFILEFFRGDKQIIYNISLGHLFSALIFIFGIVCFYKLTKRSLRADIKSAIKIVTSSQKRSLVVTRLSKSWYNLVVDWKFSMQKGIKRLSKLLNIKSNPRGF